MPAATHGSTMPVPQEQRMTNPVSKTRIGLAAGGAFFALMLLGSIFFAEEGSASTTVEPTKARAPQENPGNWISVKY